ncbi:hypothetical protein RHGRI_007697 [Rhododendron griersonianum]|uniref:Uncharacterized protein n=1 Tax=Rhododendron griersonianum TaxID=479676 RepID=A0AAV6KXX1_9ERIC|nr:hypothetical protein RHGRI_007697 [Rhododendron griersonianum]
MRYTVRDIFQATGCHWHLDDNFEYPLNPNIRYTPIVFREMQPNERRDEGLMGEALFYMEASMNEDVQSDIEMSDEDQEP